MESMALEVGIIWSTRSIEEFKVNIDDLAMLGVVMTYMCSISRHFQVSGYLEVSLRVNSNIELIHNLELAISRSSRGIQGTSHQL